MKYEVVRVNECQDESWDYTGKMVPAYWKLYRRKSFGRTWERLTLSEPTQLGAVRTRLWIEYQKHWDAAVRRKRRKDAKRPLLSADDAFMCVAITISMSVIISALVRLIQVTP